MTARGVQGFGAALTASAALSILTATFAEGPARNKALGIWGAISASGATAGVIISGVLTDGPGWEWIFFINVPVGVLIIVGALIFLRESFGEKGQSFDILGAITVTSGLILLMLGINKSESWGWTDGRTLGVLGAAVALLVAFAIIESRVRQPLVPLKRLLNRTIGIANLVAFLLLSAFFSLVFTGTLYMQQVLGYSALETGLAWLAVSLPALFAAALSGAIFVEKVGAKPLMVGGLAVLAVSLVGMSRVDLDTGYLSGILPFFLLSGLGIGVCFPAVQVSAFTGFTERDSGLASGLVNTSQEIGGAAGVAVLATIAVGITDDRLAAGIAPLEALTEGFQRAFLIGALLAAAGAVAALLLRPGDASE